MKPVEIHFKFYQRLKEQGAVVNNVLDIGCHRGKWTEDLKIIYPDAKYFLIDVLPNYKKELKKLGTVFIQGVGHKKENKNFYFAKDNLNNTGGSLYKERSNIAFAKKKISIKPLHQVVPDIIYDIIKIDVQGAELDVIGGSLDLFKKVKWLQLECPIHKNNESPYTYSDYVSMLHQIGFETFDINTVLVNNKLMYIDFIFVNKRLPKQICAEADQIEYTKNL